MTNLILATPPEHIRQAAQTHLPVAHMIYRIGRGYHLFRAQRVPIVIGGLMVLDTDGYTGGGPMSVLIKEILGECEKNAFTGIVLDIGKTSPRPLSPLTEQLGLDAVKHGVSLFVPQSLGEAGSNTVILLPTALSGGTLQDHISQALKQYGTGRVALEIERICMDFTLPAESGTGKSINTAELQSLQDQYHTQSFLSKDLCAYYFNYRDKKGIHFVLYDNAASIRRKLQIASNLGIKQAFTYYPHVADILDAIIE